MESITVKKVNHDTDLEKELIEYIRNFSWDEVKEHLLWMFDNWCYTDWETFFVAMDGDRIVGMATFAKEDYYPLPDIYPWISSLFVSEEYRGCRISGMLIDYANEYAKQNGFKRTYIPSIHTGLYEKYGYHYLKDIVNYGGDTDRLYVRDL